MFNCGHCAAPLVVDREAAGMTLNCQCCQKPISVPQPQEKASSDVLAPAADDSQVAEVKRKLKENESQRTEITGYINQLSIQLHRWQLRIQTLNERQKQLHAEMASLQIEAPGS